MDLNHLQKQIGGKAQSLPPVDSWNPDFCGDINMVIKRDGRWFYEGSPIGRASLVALFSSVLKKEDEDYFLVTPVEKVGIQVEDVPFIITNWQIENDILRLTTQTGDEFNVDATHPIELRHDPLAQDNVTVPYVNVRRNLWGRLHQNVYYQLIDIAQTHTHDGVTTLRMPSGDYAFSLGEFVE